MKFMNEYEIDECVNRFASHPVLGPAARTYAWDLSERDIVDREDTQGPVDSFGRDSDTFDDDHDRALGVEDEDEDEDAPFDPYWYDSFLWED